MLGMQSLIFGGMIIQALGQTMDSIFIASMKGLGFAGVYTLALYSQLYSNSTKKYAIYCYRHYITSLER
jgi:hypothetical protein